MNVREEIDPEAVAIENSWAWSATDAAERAARRAWIVAAVAAAIALLEAVALVWLVPLKTVEPYTLLVDRQTGHVEALAPLDATTIAPDAALTRSFLVQYVIARESFYAESLQEDYRKVSLWTAGDERQRYIDRMQATNPESPLAYVPRGGTISVEVRSVSSLSSERAMVRFTTNRTDPGGLPQPPEYWVAIVDYAFSNAEMSQADRLINPLGFQVTRYRRDAERLPEVDAATEAGVRAPQSAVRLPPRTPVQVPSPTQANEP